MDSHERLRAQIRAGRELINMNQSDLAKHLGASLSKVSRVESGETKSGDILLAFKQGLEQLGIRFTATGVEVVEEVIHIIEGEGCYLRLLDDVWASLYQKPENEKELLIMFASDKVSPPEVNAKYRAMLDDGIRVRQLIEDDDTYIMGRLNDYRTIPSKYFVNIVTLVYGNKVAQVSGGEKRITIQMDGPLSKRERGLFEYLWDTGTKPLISSSTERFFE